MLICWDNRMNHCVRVLLVTLSLFSFMGSALELANVRTERLATKVILDAQVEAVTAATVSAQVSASVKNIYVDVNDKVVAGSLLIELDDIELQVRMARAQASLAVAKAQLSQAEIEYNRLKGLESKQFVSDNDITRALSATHVARANVKLARTEISEVKQLLTYTKVVAPYSGVVTERHIEQGEMASIGQPLLSGFKLNQNRIVAQVSSALVSSIEQSGFILIKTSTNDWLELKELTISPNSNPLTHAVMVRADLDTDVLSIRPGSLVKVAVVTGEREALIVPKSAVFYQGDLAAIYVKVNDEIVLRQVLIGEEEQGRVEVLSGIKGNEVVVVDGSNFLANYHGAAD